MSESFLKVCWRWFRAGPLRGASRPYWSSRGDVNGDTFLNALAEGSASLLPGPFPGRDGGASASPGEASFLPLLLHASYPSEIFPRWSRNWQSREQPPSGIGWMVDISFSCEFIVYKVWLCLVLPVEPNSFCDSLLPLASASSYCWYCLWEVTSFEEYLELAADWTVLERSCAPPRVGVAGASCLLKCSLFWEVAWLPLQEGEAG